ncbi:nicotinate-nucleotide adenylyltransferase [Arenibaculum pallidiluteum]|uniref:nicotinate-nucleotide adenylyltransferase n=1 Tax=Arenibaculum pallidiluteum TaxID=2812559 RepID=UPI001A95B671|nr:nicotinate-nucleotide adenylyltransferase [Arenibaculum pallidiluteum]
MSTPRPPLFPPPRRLAGRAWDGLAVGLLGGSFNPAHAGHRHASLEALRRLGLDAVWWLVSPQNPLKARAGMAPLAERLAGARAAARHPRIVPTAIESSLGSVYTAETLARLRAFFPRTRFVWLMGADNLIQIPRWQHWERIFRDVPVAVMDRPPYSSKALVGKAAQRFRGRRLKVPRARRLARTAPPAWVFLTHPLHPASASEIRRRRAIASAPNRER